MSPRGGGVQNRDGVGLALSRVGSGSGFFPLSPSIPGDISRVLFHPRPEEGGDLLIFTHPVFLVSLTRWGRDSNPGPPVH